MTFHGRDARATSLGAFYLETIMPGPEPSIVHYEWLSADSHLYRLTDDASGEIRLDMSGVDPAQIGSISLKLIGASALHCLAGTVAAFLEGRGATIRSLKGRATIEQTTNDQRRVQASSMVVELDVDVDEEHAHLLDKARMIIEERGCMVTYSLGRGMDIKNVIRKA